MGKEPEPFEVNRREFLTATGSLIAGASAFAGPVPNPATEALPGFPGKSFPEPLRQKRPAWWREQGLVMAGVNWESLLPRLRFGSAGQPQAFMDYDEKMAIWRREHSEEVAQRLKDMGFNFLMIPLYKGGGLKAERTSMEDAKRFTEICHRLGLRVGCYTSSGTILYESLLAEIPEAKDWFILDQNGKYATYEYGPLYFRRWANRSHPGYRKLMRELVRFAVEEAKVDLIHLDNYLYGPGYEPYSVRQFREYLKSKYSPEERTRRFGFAEVECIEPPPAPLHADDFNGDPLYRDFVDYRCEVLADTYRELAEYARSLNPEIVMECNTAGYVGELNRSLDIGTVDHTRLLQWGGAFWDEGYPTRLENGIVPSKFRSMMLGRQYGNMVFLYTSDRVAMAESMAFNLQSAGCAAWVNGDDIIPYLSKYDAKQFDPQVLALIRFFRREQQYYRDAELIADVGVLSTYANTAYGPCITRKRWAALTQALYQGKVPFILVPDRCPGDLSRFQVLVLADLAVVSDELVDVVRRYVQQGGGLVMTGQAAEFDEQNHRRKQPGLADLFPEPLADKVLHAKPGKGRAIYIPRVVIPEKFQMWMLPENRAELLEAVRWATNGPLQVEVKAPETVAMSLFAQPGGRHLLHLVNYDQDHPVRDIDVTVQLPSENRIASIRMVSPASDETRTLAVAQTGRAVHFTVPRLEVYGLLVIE
jgi:hypothetical protein